MKVSTTISLERLSGVCGDDVTPAAVIHVEGPNGSFDWCGGQPALEAVHDFLACLRQVDHRVAQAVSIVRTKP